MSYTVPHYSPEPKRWPHWYSLLSLLFHGWVIWRGVAITQWLAARGHAFADWFGDQKLLFFASIFMAFVCLLSLALRTRATSAVILNAIYCLLIMSSLLMHFSFVGDSPSPVDMFANLGGLMIGLVLLNALYTLFRYLTRHER